MKSCLIALLLLIGAVEPCGAQISAGAIEQLRHWHPEAAERELSILQTSFEKGLASEYDVLDSYKVFGKDDPILLRSVDEWIRRYPKSASAYLARGTYYRKRGEARRGTRYVAKTPASDMRYMMTMFSKAKPDLLKAAQLNQRSYLAELSLLNIATHEGDLAAARKALASATRILPSTVLVRTRYAVMLTPRWGGNHAQLDSFIADCRAAGVPKETVSLLQAIKFEDLGQDAEESGDLDAAKALYQRALPLSRSGGPRFRNVYLYNSLRFCQHYKFGGSDCS